MRGMPGLEEAAARVMEANPTANRSDAMETTTESKATLTGASVGVGVLETTRGDFGCTFRV